MIWQSVSSWICPLSHPGDLHHRKSIRAIRLHVNTWDLLESLMGENIVVSSKVFYIRQRPDFFVLKWASIDWAPSLGSSVNKQTENSARERLRVVLTQATQISFLCVQFAVIFGQSNAFTSSLHTLHSIILAGPAALFRDEEVGILANAKNAKKKRRN